MTTELIQRIWDSSEFHSLSMQLTKCWLQRELGIDQRLEISDVDLVRCIQAAAILASSDIPAHQRVSYTIAASAADLKGVEFPGLAGALRVVLSRMGNFPALSTSRSTHDFRSLPMQIALAEELRRQANTVDTGDTALVLTDFQRRLWQLLQSGRSALISAPTSAGKSFVLQNYLRQLTRTNRLNVACYVVPSRALIAQVTDAIAEWRQVASADELHIINIPPSINSEIPEPSIFVVTQERLQAVLTTHPQFSPEIIICDEVQVIQEGARGVLLQSVVEEVLRRKESAQLILSGPNIRNLGTFRKTFNIDFLEVQTRSPTVVQNLIVVDSRSAIKGRLTLEHFTPFRRSPLGYTDITSPTPSITERLVRVSERFGQNKPSIVYANRPYDAEKVASGLAEVLPQVAASARLQELSEFVKTAVHPKYDLAKCLLQRVGFHYGRIPALVRRGVEAAFASGDIQYLVTTSTLIQGVNFPAANLFVCNPKKGQTAPLDAAEFWNLAGRAGRLGKEFQGNIFLIDYDTWKTSPANEGNEVDVEAFLVKLLRSNIDAVETCAQQLIPPKDSDRTGDIEAAFTRLLLDFRSGNLGTTLARADIDTDGTQRITRAIDSASKRVSLPLGVLTASPTMSAFRQQRLAEYLSSEIKGGGTRRLEELMPRHPRDPDAYRSLSEIYKICHDSLLSLSAPRLHLRMAAISLKWMRGDALPEIIDENYRRSPNRTIGSCIRDTLNDIEQEIRFRYVRLTTCYIAVLGHLLTSLNKSEYAASMSALPTYLEVGASDETMVSFISLGLSRMTAKLLTRETIHKEMTPAEALQWLRRQNLDELALSPIIRGDISRALSNALLPSQRSN